MNCVLLGILTRLYLDNMALEANILLLLLLEQPTIANIVAHYLLYKKNYILHKTHSAKRNKKQMKRISSRHF
jgi:hypothetical protein